VKRTRFVTAFMLALSLIFGLAQDAGRGRMPKWLGIEDHELYPENIREFHRGQFSDATDWKANQELPNDCFTYARLRYPSTRDGRGWGGRYHFKWQIDYPEADINLSNRLQQMTSIIVNPNPVICDIDPEQMRHYPFFTMTEVGDIDLTDERAKIMRDYMLNGGFIMVDDFWGYREWDNFERALKQIWPDRNFVELDLTNDIFHSVFDLKVMPQIPGIRFAERARDSGDGRFYEWDKPGSEEVHYRAYYDDRKRMCMIICYNTDNGDGWEEEATDPWYFREFSEKYAFPLGINIIYYSMTH
jgi:hypothetical protein